MRMALGNDTITGRALLYALLAISSLRRNGPCQEALAFKVSTLHALSTSLKGGYLGFEETSQHIATCMLLCTFEVGH